MKKINMFFLALLIIVAVTAPSLASSNWDDFVAKSIQYEKIKDLGIPVIDNLRKLAPQVSEAELWNKLWQGDAQSRSVAGLALMDSIFPNGDSSRWEEVSGFLSNSGRQPRQLAGLDALFVVAAAVRELPNGIWASAFLLDRFGKSTRGRMYFIDDTTPEIRALVDDVIAKTALKGDWSSSVIRGHTPLLPRYNGYISLGRAMDRHMYFLNGYGAIAGNGNYAWDRDTGYIYDISEQMGVVSPSL